MAHVDAVPFIRAFLALLILGLILGDSPPIQSGAGPARQKLSVHKMTLVNFDGPKLPQNKDGDSYPSQYEGVGKAVVRLTAKGAVSGKCLQLELTAGRFYPQFNPYGYKLKVNREFARNYAADPARWKFNTYDRMRFWIKVPPDGPPHRTTGQGNMEFGTYVKRVKEPDRNSDEAGGDHYYHLLNLPATGHWTQVILNMHPSHRRSAPGGMEQGFLPHPTGEKDYNYFDALTRFYLDSPAAPARYPAFYYLDEFEFYREPNQENDRQVYSITGTYVPEKNRIIITWSRPKDENDIKHEIRYAFSSIHEIGWSKAMPAPKGIIAPLGWQGYNGMVYDTAVLPLAKKQNVYIAIKPQNAKTFSQISVPLLKGQRKDQGADKN